ncbi:hypothetical protein [Arcobacter sp. CECT 8985]|uniref:hypothetical protein n=1 Tax=Arcobacter sp. CECT 8985 TaxID=1935424 RepID=UPI00100B2369|nr:hypothetical protein [Arcobacter sp. CECT 8985]RXJ86939.1 hypothetical protein CRU93_06040 [Arcobacter sp. CECT 8985]
MSKKYISQSELASLYSKPGGCTQQYIAKLKKKKYFDEVLDNNGKFLRSKTHEYLTIIEESKDETREAQRQANSKEDNEDISHGKNNQNTIAGSTDLTKEFGMFDVSYLGAEAQVELTALLESGGKEKSAVQKIQIKDAFIESKRKELEFKKELGVLIELEEAEAVMELVAANMKTKMYNVSHLFKSKYHKTTKEQVEFLYKLIDEAFGEFNKYGLDDVKGEKE